jgi:ABC-type branched-subunit amino acid transport system ATPase component
MAMLSVKNLNKSFGGLQAITGLNFDVEPGEIVSVIGPNGAGKTTLFNLITGVYEPDSGDIRLEGDSIVGKRPNQIVDLGIARTFQNLRLFTNLSVLDNVLIPQHHKLTVPWWQAVLRTSRYRRAEAAMHEVGLEKLSFFGPRLMSFRLHQPVYRLSYANRRRTEMARAMATGAKMMLLDEPSAGMNPKETKEITQIIRRMRDEGGYTILLVEHKMNLVGEISDRVIVLDYGQKIAEGAYEKVVNDATVLEAYLGKQARGQGEKPGRGAAVGDASAPDASAGDASAHDEGSAPR